MSEKDEKSLEEAMIDSVAIDKVGDLVGDIAEIGLDSILDGGLIKDIPIIGVVAKSVGAAFAIRDRIFAKKVLRFLIRLDDVPQSKRQEFIDNLRDKNERRKVGETIILMLDRFDNMLKADLFGKLFSVYISGYVSKREYERMIYIVSQVYLHDLVSLIAAYQNARIPSFPGQDLARFGLLKTVGELRLDNQSFYELSDLGKLLMDVALKDWLEENRKEFDE